MPSNVRLASLYNKLNNSVFNNELPHSDTHDFNLLASNRLTSSYGSCHLNKNPNKATHAIKIAGRIVDWMSTGDPTTQLLQTLLHEMTHLVMHIRDGHAGSAHGPRWRKEWIKVGKTYDSISGTTHMERHARFQCMTHYANCPENKQRATSSDNPTKYKWNLICPVCGHEHVANRMGKNLKLATLYNGLVRHGKLACTAKLEIVSQTR
jgi:hypothetical protein